eukprot:82959_1
MGASCCGDEPDDARISGLITQKDKVTPREEREAKQYAKITSRSPYGRKMTDEKQDYEEKLNADDFINQITVYVIQARNLPKYDIGINAKSDPYVKVTIGKAEYKAHAVRRELNPIWNDQFVKQGKALFSRINEIQFDIYDHDKLTKDDLMGHCVVKTDNKPNAHYSTAVQWINMVNENDEPVLGKNGKRSAIQIQIKYAINAEDLNVRYWTHVMELKIKQGKNIHSKEFIGKSDPYVKVEWGAQSYQTKYVNDTNKPVWNESAFIFVHEKYQNKFQLKLTVMDKDIGTDDLLGTGYVAADRIFKECKNGSTFGLDVTLRMVPVNLDRGLIDFEKNKNFKPWGDLEVEAKLISRTKVEADFFQVLAKGFDKNGDGVIDKNEVQTMFATLRIPENVDEFFNKFDENGDSKLDEDEIVKMLSDSDFQGSELATQLIGHYLAGDLGNDFRKHLMSGFSVKSSDTNRVIQLKDRETGLLVQEFVPGYVWYSLRLLYDVKLNRALVQSKISNRILYQMSKSRGQKMDQPKSSAEIPAFIKQHNLDSSMLYKKPNQFKTFN